MEGNGHTGTIDINGRTYVHSIWQYSSTAGNVNQTQYDLKRGCDQLTYTAGVTDDSSSDAIIQFEVYGDNRLLKSFRLGYGDDARQTVNVTNVLRLKLLNTGIGASGNLYAGWGDAAVRCSITTQS